MLHTDLIFVYNFTLLLFSNRISIVGKTHYNNVHIITMLVK